MAAMVDHPGRRTQAHEHSGYHHTHIQPTPVFEAPRPAIPRPTPLEPGGGSAPFLPSLNQIGLATRHASGTTSNSHRREPVVDFSSYDVSETSDGEDVPAEDPKSGKSSSPKRKSQNRAAQRTLRRRRAARVNELEEELERQKEKYKQGDAELTDQIGELELEVASYQSKCRLLEEMLEQERGERLRAEVEVEAFKRPYSRGKGTSPA